MDWLPTLAEATGVNPWSDLPLDGESILPVLRGEGGEVCSRRFWQWNRYTPVVQSNAAMRDGDWKLLRPAIRETMHVTAEDLEMDRGLKYEPGLFDDIRRQPMPEYEISTPPPPQFYNIAEDPEESDDLAEAQPDRARRMLRELETWFEEVEAERRAIPEADWF